MFGPVDPVVPVDPAHIRAEDIDRAAREEERILAWLDEAAIALKEIVGEGIAESGLVRAMADADGRVMEVLFEPRAAREDSRTLAADVRAAVGLAQDDARRQARELVQNGIDVDLDELDRQFGRVLEAFDRSTDI